MIMIQQVLDSLGEIEKGVKMPKEFWLKALQELGEDHENTSADITGT